ncbi:MAG: GAF domain-containing sensor histidine kinase [Acidobacteria bacterium]|nr:GAF domain-containing sensor histidine kinase [Acidobacteriota bacterium]MBV9071748.1 GAF domain-containing sensor histidine kinase [Acidobacteriota bacterium]MBV9187066.1 GAF domain-containing sensor histidine kinase [Acidobacteriota bacterium]
MTLRRLRLLTFVTPVVIVLTLEVLRILTVGETSFRTRLILDGIVAVAFIVFGAVMVRAISQASKRQRRQNAELLALHGAGVDVTAELSLDAVLNKVVDRARTLVGARYGALSVVNDDGSIQAFLTSGVTPEQRAKIGPPPVGHGLLGVVLHKGERLRLPDIGTDPRSHGFPPNHPVMHSLLAVPVTCKGPFVGNLYLSEKLHGGAFTTDDEETLERFAVQAAIAIDNAHLHRQVADLAVAQERLRIAHEMHDGIAQVLGYVNTKVQAATEYIRRGNTDEGLDQLRQLAEAAREAYSDVRESIVDLRALPGPARSFRDVLEEYIDRWQEQTGITSQLSVDPDITLAPGNELQLVRIIQESLTNVRKHSRATSVSVGIRKRDGKLRVAVTDNGIGFSEGTLSRGVFPRFGLSTMRERAESMGAAFTVESAPAGGTSVFVDIPLT